jgi:hypothetical protein
MVSCRPATALNVQQLSDVGLRRGLSPTAKVSTSKSGSDAVAGRWPRCLARDLVGKHLGVRSGTGWGEHLDTAPARLDLARSYSPSGLILRGESQGNVRRGYRSLIAGADGCRSASWRFLKAHHEELTHTHVGAVEDGMLSHRTMSCPRGFARIRHGSAL